MRLRETTKKNPTNNPDSKIKGIQQLLLAGKRIMLVSHVDPDGDAIGTLLAFAFYLKELGKDYVMVRDSEIPHKYLFLTGVEEIKPMDQLDPNDSFDTVLVLECPTLERAGKVAKFINDDTTVINIDHHQDATEFGTINWFDFGVSSVGEMAFEYFENIGFDISPVIAEHLYTAILTDTGRFRYASTSPRTLAIAGKLIAAGADPSKICDEVYYNIPPEVIRLTGMVLNTVEFHQNNKICLLHMTREMLSRAGTEASATEGLVDFSMFNKEVLIGSLLKETGPNETKISLRSRDDINVAAIAEKFDGGGHVNAAGCTLRQALPEARKILLEILKEAVDGRS